MDVPLLMSSCTLNDPSLTNGSKTDEPVPKTPALFPVALYYIQFTQPNCQWKREHHVILQKWWYSLWRSPVQKRSHWLYFYFLKRTSVLCSIRITLSVPLCDIKSDYTKCRNTTLEIYSVKYSSLVIGHIKDYHTGHELWFVQIANIENILDNSPTESV